MILITKNREPDALLQLKLQQKRAGVTPRYSHLQGENENTDKGKVRLALLIEQGYLCAYCMRRIEFHSTKIEHWKAQSSEGTNHQHEVDYNNLLGVCFGSYETAYNTSRNRTMEDHCEQTRKEKPLTVNPTEVMGIAQITYSKDGKIKSTNQNIHNDLKDTLLLNMQTLRINRKSTWEGVEVALNILSKRNADKKWRKSEVQKQLDKYYNRDVENHLIPYCGIVRYFLEKKIREFQ